MTDIFTWDGKNEATGTTTFRVRKAQFGGGYVQTVADGPNNGSDSWPLTFTGTAAYIGAIRDFLAAHKGATSFYWTPPMGTQGLYRCESFALSPHGRGLYTLTATFQQVFAP